MNSMHYNSSFKLVSRIVKVLDFKALVEFQCKEPGVFIFFDSFLASVNADFSVD